jgi:hypothetical protein
MNGICSRIIGQLETQHFLNSLFTNGDSGNWKFLLNPVPFDNHDNKEFAIVNDFLNEKLKMAISDSSE